LKRMYFAIESPEPKTLPLEDVLKSQDVKLIEGQKNIKSNVVIPEPKIVFKEPNEPRGPNEELERSRRLLEPPKTEAPGLTVGDLSIVRQKAAERKELNNLFCLPKDSRGLHELFVGRPVHRAPLPESQKLLQQKYEHDAKVDDIRQRLQNPSAFENEASELTPKTKAAIEEAEKRVQQIDDYERFERLRQYLRDKGIAI